MLLTELERREIRGRRDGPAGFVDGDREIHAGERDVRILVGQLREVVGKNEADADHEVHPFRGEQAQPGLPVGTLSRFHEPHPRAELLCGALGPDVGAIIEGLVATSPEVEHDADFHRVARGRPRCARWMHEEQRHVDGEQRESECQELAHERDRIAARATGGKQSSGDGRDAAAATTRPRWARRRPASFPEWRTASERASW